MSDITESTPKSSDERIYRKLRITGQNTGKVTSKHVAGKGRHMKGRVVPKKTANNDPRRNNPFVGEEFENLFLFEKPGDLAHLESIEDKDRHLLFVNRLIATQMGGWEEEDGTYVNESGHVAFPENWVLVDGNLVSKKTDKLEGAEISTEWLHNIREKLEQLIEEKDA